MLGTHRGFEDRDRGLRERGDMERNIGGAGVEGRYPCPDEAL
jgi:hypothetical protein